MKIEIKVPSMGESVNEATIATLLKPSGSLVAMDEEILELETDKVNQVLTAPKAGTITFHVKVGDTVKIGQLVASIETSQESASPVQPTAQPKSQKEEKSTKAPSSSIPPKEEKPKEAATSEGARYTQEQFVRDLKQPPSPPTEPSTQPLPRESRKRMSRLRQVIAHRLLEATQTTAMLTTFNEIDMSAVIAAREKFKEAFFKKHGIKLGFMSWFVKACVYALENVPELNSYIDGEELVHRNFYDIGIAVGTQRGLMVPVVRDCDHLTFAQIEKAIASFAQKAREGGISVDDLQGGGFTITNGGIYGSLLSTPILNPPQSGILGMHKIQERAVVVDGQMQVRPMMYVALSYDHRVVDGQQAVTFLVRLKDYIEDPLKLLLGL